MLAELYMEMKVINRILQNVKVMKTFAIFIIDKNNRKNKITQK